MKNVIEKLKKNNYRHIKIMFIVWLITTLITILAKGFTLITLIISPLLGLTYVVFYFLTLVGLNLNWIIFKNIWNASETNEWKKCHEIYEKKSIEVKRDAKK